MSAIEQYVELRKQEASLKQSLEAAKQAATAEAMELGQLGQLGVYAGAKVTLKFVPIKPKPTPEIQQLIEWAEHQQQLCEAANQAKIAELSAQVEALQVQVEALRTNPERKATLAEVEQLMAQLAGEKQPQLAVSFVEERPLA